MAQKVLILVALLSSGYYLAESTITLGNNGYSGILVGIAEDVPQPLEDNGAALVQDLKVIFSN